MENNNRFSSSLAFIDMLFGMALANLCLFALSFMMIKPIIDDKHKGLELKAEYVITMTWPDDAYDDVDLWVMLPNKKRVNFRNKDVQYVTLDRDDRGIIGDMFLTAEGQQAIVLNKEVITFRAVVPGRYVVNAHMYSTINYWNGKSNPKSPPYPIKITLIKLNPVVKDVITREVVLERIGQQKTAFAFDIKPNGEVVNISYDDVPFIQPLSLAGLR